MSQANKKVIEQFYTAFQNGDVEKMIACYHTKIVFEDPAFGVLKGAEAGSMWRMLIERGKGNIDISYSDVQADEQNGSAHWEAKYPFSKTGRKVHNKIDASFQFKDGKIIQHTDKFDLWKWSSMALGMSGTLLGWTPFMRNKIKQLSRGLLKKYMEK
ncbi:MAG: nuclear transport factor 2 family protein [Bacteroidota bacterium]